VADRKPIHWVGDSLKRLREFPVAVRSEIGQALYQAELGEGHPSASPMQGINAVEIVSNYRGDTYRGIYTTKFKGQIYVLHCFQKKSKAGIRTPKRDLELIRTRLAEAQLHLKANEGK
jgi:phage-related protein